MKRRSKTGDNAGRAGRHKAATPKRSIPPKAATTLETKIARLARERDEAPEQRKATTVVLRLISASTTLPASSIVAGVD